MWFAFEAAFEATRAVDSAADDELRRSRRVRYQGADLDDLLRSDDNDEYDNHFVTDVDVSSAWPQHIMDVNGDKALSWGRRHRYCDRRRRYCFDGSNSCFDPDDDEDESALDLVFLDNDDRRRDTARSLSTITRHDDLEGYIAYSTQRFRALSITTSVATNVSATLPSNSDAANNAKSEEQGK